MFGNNLFAPEKMREAWEIISTEAPFAIWETFYATLLATFFAILLGLPLGVLLVTGENPISVYGTIFNASFSSSRRTWVLVQNIAMLLCVSLAVVPARLARKDVVLTVSGAESTLKAAP